MEEPSISKVDNVETKEQSIISNLQATPTETKVETKANGDTKAKVETEETKVAKVVKVGGQVKKNLIELAEKSENYEAIMIYLQDAQKIGLMSDGTRATAKSDSDGMIAIRKDFLKSCKKHSDGYNLKKNGTKEYYCIDLDKVVRIPRIYIKKPKDTDNDSTKK